MRKKIVLSLLVLCTFIFLSAKDASYTSTKINSEAIAIPCNLHGNESDGSCTCDAARLYIAYINSGFSKDTAILAAADYLTACQEFDQQF